MTFTGFANLALRLRFATQIRYTLPMPAMKTPRLILISGPPGVGKSTLSRALAQKLQATHLDKDCIDEPFSPGDRGTRYTRIIEPKVLTATLSLAELNLRVGHAVLLDVPWTHIQLNTPSWTRKIKALAKKTRSKLFVIECFLTESEHRTRLKKRGYLRDKVRISDTGWKKFKKSDRLSERNPLPHFTIDMGASRESCVKQALTFLSR